MDHATQRLNRLHWARGAILVAHHVRDGESLNTLANRFCDGNTDYAWRNVAMLLRLVAREAKCAERLRWQHWFAGELGTDFYPGFKGRVVARR